MFDPNERVVVDSLGVCECERRRLHGTVERSPDVDDADSVFKQLFSFLLHVKMDTRGRRRFGLVNVDSGDWIPVSSGSADGVVEQEDAVGSGYVVQKELFDFRVVVLLDRLVGSELFLGRRIGLECGERIIVKIER